MELVKIKSVKNSNVVKEVLKSLASDYVGTGDWTLVEEEVKKDSRKDYSLREENKND